ncbi:MAG: hypothetical protein QOE67_255 [Solirubrobacteraceae bacterium]|nr:hypothetical protein [Solirubrobacteraceae bacterium]
MFRKMINKKRAIVLGAVAVFAVAGIAVAFFTSSGSGTGSASVGKSTAFTVTVGSPSGGPLYPGSGSETLAYTVKNPSPGSQNLASTSAKVASSGGNITQGGEAVSGCLAADFTATNTSVSKNLAGGESIGSSVEVTMQDSGINQDACQGTSPDITVEAK